MLLRTEKILANRATNATPATTLAERTTFRILRSTKAIPKKMSNNSKSCTRNNNDRNVENPRAMTKLRTKITLVNNIASSSEAKKNQIFSVFYIFFNSKIAARQQDREERRAQEAAADAEAARLHEEVLRR